MYEIEITNMELDEDMKDIVDALFFGSIKGQDIDGSGLYLESGIPRSVFVDKRQVKDAVGIINRLGYETDEDDTQSETDSKFSIAMSLAQYLNEQGIPCSTGTNTGEIVTCAFYTENGTWLEMSYDLEEWDSAIAIGDNVINLFNHNGKIPQRKGESLYFRVSSKMRFGGWRFKRHALDNSDLDELLAAYGMADRANDERAKIIIGLQIKMIEDD
jgi:hypothetical protein